MIPRELGTAVSRGSQAYAPRIDDSDPKQCLRCPVREAELTLGALECSGAVARTPSYEHAGLLDSGSFC